MGTDIHGVAQIRYPRLNDNDKPYTKWTDAMKIEDDRNYFVFAVLANVRNGEGFAGIPTHTPVVPIQESRGLPEDFLVDSDIEDIEHVEQRYSVKYYTKKGIELEDGTIIDTFHVSEFGDILTTTWMGDHSHGWITLDEWYNWPYWREYVTHQGIVSREEYAEWVSKGSRGAPSSYCGGIAGYGVKVWNGEGQEPHDWTHRKITWQTMNVDNCEVFWAFMEYLDAKYGECPGRSNVRLVFGFDS